MRINLFTIKSMIALCSTLRTDLANGTGIVTKALADLQRFIACSLAFAPNFHFNNAEKARLQFVVASPHVSARVSLVMKSNNAIRIGLGLPAKITWYAMLNKHVLLVSCQLL